MASEQKAFASLSSGLLARKGAARPAMRPQGFGGQLGSGLEDLGWNDMGFEPPKPAPVAVLDADHDAFGEELPEQPVRHSHAGLTPVQSPVHNQQAEIADRFVADNEEDEDLDETAELYDSDADAAGDLVAKDQAPVEEMAAPVPVFTPVPVPTAAPIIAPAPAARRSAKARAAPGTKARAAFTLRLDPQRHLKLRLACAVSGRSAQLLVTDALDRLLADMPELDELAAKANRKD